MFDLRMRCQAQLPHRRTVLTRKPGLGPGRNRERGKEATRVFTEDQYRVVAGAITVINAFNRLGVTSRKPLPAQR